MVDAENDEACVHVVRHVLPRLRHRVDPAEIAGAFAKLKAQGKVREFGVSNFTPTQVTALQRACPMPLLVNQVQIHLGDLHCFVDGTLDQCLAENITPLAWSPLAGGLLGGVLQGLLRGVLIGAVISLVLLIRRASRPHVAFLGRIPGTRRYSDLARHSDNEPVPGVLIFRPESGLLYFNADHVRDIVEERARSLRPKLVLGDFSAAPHVDMQAAQMLAELHDELAALGCRLQIVEARASVRDTLRREGVEAKAGNINRFTSVADAVDDFLNPSSDIART